MRLSVVIPTFRRPDTLPRALAALEGQTTAPDDFEVVVVDDPIDDDSDSVARQIDADRRSYAVRRLHRPARGVSAARNAGWRAARAPLVLFLGDDILARPELLREHLDWHERHPGEDVGVLGHVRWAREVGTTAFMRWLDHSALQFDYAAIEGAEAGAGRLYTSNVSLKRAMLERVGGFDEQRFPFGYEDIDLGVRLAAHGFRLLYNRRAAAEHLHRPTLDEWRRRMAHAAVAERAWLEAHPGERPYFYEKLAPAMAARPARGRRGRLLLRFIGPAVPLVGPWVWRSADLYFRQQLAPAFLAAWGEQEPAA